MNQHVTTPYSPVCSQCSQSHICPQNKECPMPHQKNNRPVLSWKSHYQVHNHTWTKYSSPRGIPETQQSIQWGLVPETSPVNFLGPHHRTTARSTKHPPRKTTPTHPGRKRQNAQICARTPQKRDNLCIQITLCSQFLLCEEKVWPVQDYWPINKWTKKNKNISPLIPQVVNHLSRCTKFIIIDICWGYNNIQIKGDEGKATFLTHKGLFEPTVMFFRLTNSPATFQMMINTIFQKEVGEGWLLMYMDDIAIHTARHPHETEEQHTTHHREYIYQMLDKLEEHDLYLKSEKCQFEKDEIKYLGVIMGKGCLQMSPKKLQGIADLSPPKNPTEVCSFIGFTRYYRYFIPNYSKIAQPLLDLIKKTTPWRWVTWWAIGMLMLTNIYIYFSHTPAGVVTTSFTLSYLLSNPLQPRPIVCTSLRIITKVLTLICRQFLWPYCCWNMSPLPKHSLKVALV